MNEWQKGFALYAEENNKKGHIG